MIEFAMAISRLPKVGQVIVGQVTGHPTEKDGNIIHFGPLVKCIKLNDSMYTVKDLNETTINVLVRDPAAKRLEPPKNYDKKPKSVRPNWKR